MTFVATDVTFAQNLSEGDDGQVGRRDIVCGASGGGGGAPGIGGAIASLEGRVTILRGGADGSCRFVANSARGGSGGDVRELDVRELAAHPRCAGRGAGGFGGTAGDIAPAGV